LSSVDRPPTAYGNVGNRPLPGVGRVVESGRDGRCPVGRGVAAGHRAWRGRTC